MHTKARPQGMRFSKIMQALAPFAASAVLAFPVPLLAQEGGRPSGRIETAAKPGIFGKDTRRSVPERYADLARSVGLIEARLGRSRTLCTTFCVADEIVATAAHCLVAPLARHRLGGVSIAIGQGKHRRTTGIAGVNEEGMAWSVLTGMTRANSAAPYNTAHDWALVRLADPVCKGRNVQLSSRGERATPWPELPSSEMFILAYHADTGVKSLRLSDDCTSSDMPLEPDLARWLHTATNVSSERLLLHRCDITRGTSGSAVFVETSAGASAIAVNVVAEGISRRPGQRQEWDKRVSANRAVLIDAFRQQIPLLGGTPEAVSRDDLRLLQGVLKETGYYRGELTGRYEMDLRQAVLDLERAHGQLPTGRPSSRLIEAARLVNASPNDRKGTLRDLLKDGQVPTPAAARDAESDYALIAAAATKAIELDSRFAFAYASRAAVHMAKGEHEQAVADYTRLIAIDGKLAAAYNSRARAYHASKDYERAIADFTKAIELDANNVDAYLGRSLVHFEMGDFDRAIGELDRAIAIDPRNAIAYNNRAWVYLKAGRAALGFADAKRSLELRPQEAFSLDTLAHILEAMGRREEAIEAFRAALAVDPSLKESIEGLKRLGAEP